MAILVGYASKHGATESIAERIAVRLRDDGLPARTERLDRVEELASWDAVVVGCPVYATAWHRRGVHFLRRMHAELRERRERLWVFTVGGAPRITAAAARLVEPLHPVEHAYLRGAVDPAELGPLERRMIRAARACTGDFRNWDEVDAFADRIAAACG